jgi:hypothetical protein
MESASLVRKKEPETSILDVTGAQFQALSDAKAVELLRVQSITVRLKARHALAGQFVALATYVGSLGAFVYLVMNGHPKLAPLALGAPVLTVVKRMLDNRL